MDRVNDRAHVYISDGPRHGVKVEEPHRAFESNSARFGRHRTQYNEGSDTVW